MKTETPNICLQNYLKTVYKNIIPVYLNSLTNPATSKENSFLLIFLNNEKSFLYSTVRLLKYIRKRFWRENSLL